MLNWQVTNIGFKTRAWVNGTEIKLSVIYKETDNEYQAAWITDDSRTPKWQKLRIATDDMLEMEKFILCRLTGLQKAPWEYVTGASSSFETSERDALADLFKIEQV